MRLVVMLAALSLATPAAAESELQKLQRWLYPHRAVTPAPVPAPIIPPQIEPTPSPPIAAPEPPPAVAAPPRRTSPKPRPRPKPVADGPDLPWPCWVVRLHAVGKTRAELEAEGRRNGIVLTPKQRRQAAACLAGT